MVVHKSSTALWRRELALCFSSGRFWLGWDPVSGVLLTGAVVLGAQGTPQCSGLGQGPESPDLFLAANSSNINPAPIWEPLCHWQMDSTVSEAFSKLTVMSRTLRASSFSCRHTNAQRWPQSSRSPWQCSPDLFLFPTRSFISKLMPALLSLPVHFTWCISHFVLFWPSPAEGVVVLQWRAGKCPRVLLPQPVSALHEMWFFLLSENQDCFALCCSSGDSGFLDSINILLMKYCFVKESWKLKRVFKLLPVSQYHVMSTLPRRDNSEMSHKACVMPFAVWQNSSAFILFNPSSEIFCSEKVWDQSCQYLLTQSWCKSLCYYWLPLSCNDLPQARIKPKLGIWETQYQTFKEDGAEWHRCWKWECGWK